MKKFARIQNNEVLEIIEADELPPFHPEVASQFEEVDLLVEEGYIRPDSNGVFTAPVPIIPTPEDQKLIDLRATEDLGTISRKLEDVIDYIENGTPLPAEAKAWMANRKVIRG